MRNRKYFLHLFPHLAVEAGVGDEEQAAAATLPRPRRSPRPLAAPPLPPAPPPPPVPPSPVAPGVPPALHLLGEAVVVALLGEHAVHVGVHSAAPSTDHALTLSLSFCVLLLFSFFLVFIHHIICMVYMVHEEQSSQDS